MFVDEIFMMYSGLGNGEGGEWQGGGWTLVVKGVIGQIREGYL